MKMNHMVSLGLMLCSSVLFAENISIIGTVEQKIQLNHMPNKANGVVSNNKVLSKTIDLINVQLSDAAQQTLYQRVTQLLQPMPGFEGAVEPISGARSVQLGMNNVPVLDQGQHLRYRHLFSSLTKSRKIFYNRLYTNVFNFIL